MEHHDDYDGDGEEMFMTPPYYDGPDLHCARCGALHLQPDTVRWLGTGDTPEERDGPDEFVCVDRDACDRTIEQAEIDNALGQMERRP